jgi:secreted PhoX family phosphatase
MAVTVGGGLTALGACEAAGERVERIEGYGPLVSMGALALPRGFSYKEISRQGVLMTDGNPTPGIFDGMGAFPGPDGSTVLIRNHENQRKVGEISVMVPEEERYDQDPTYVAGNTKLVVDRNLEIVEDFAILGGTDKNCAGGQMPWGSWITCEEIVNRGDTGTPHGYIFEIDASAGGPVKARPVTAAGRLVHEAVAWLDGVLYETEDRRDDSFFYRYIPENLPGSSGDFADTDGVLQALKIKGVNNAVMDAHPRVGKPYEVEWVSIEEPNPVDDTDSTPLAVGEQAKAQGAAIFDREEGIWVRGNRVYFDCTEGGEDDLGQVYEFDPRSQTITLIYESTSVATLKNPDNIVIVPKTGDIFLQEDSEGEHFVRGLTPEGEIYNFARTITNSTEFCGGCFSPYGPVFFVNQQGERGALPEGPAGQNAVTYAITGPFQQRSKARV